jgi:hypothetical protein
MVSAPARSRAWRVAHSWWLALILFSWGFLAWAAFGYLGFRASHRRWVAWGGLYLALGVATFSLLLVGGDTNSTAAAVVGTLLFISLGLGSFVHGLVIRREALLRLSLAASLRRSRAEELEQELAQELARQQPAQMSTFSRQLEGGRGQAPASRGRFVEASQVGAAAAARSAQRPLRRLRLWVLSLMLLGALASFPVFVLGLLLLWVAAGEHYVTAHQARVMVLVALAGSLILLAAIVASYLNEALDRVSLSTPRGRLACALTVLTGAVLVAGTGYIVFVWIGRSPVSVRAPVVTGRPRLGATLEAHPGEWSPSRGLAFNYQWEQCARGICIEFAPASRFYPLAGDDYGKRIRVCVVASGEWDSDPACSHMTSRVR